MSITTVEVTLTRKQIDEMCDNLLIEGSTVTLDCHNDLINLHVIISMKNPKPCTLCGNVKES